MKYSVILALSAALLLPACKPSSTTEAASELKAEASIQRFASITGLNPEKVTDYEKLHANPWPSISRKITECNIRNYSIHKREIDGKIYLFSYFEYVGDDFSEDMKRMAADPETQRWWKETDPCQIPLPDAASKGEIWSGMEEVFFQP